MTVKNKGEKNGQKNSQSLENSESKDISIKSSSNVVAPSFRIIVGSYEHTLLCLSLVLYPEGEIFTPIFYFTPHTQSIRCLARSKRYLASGANDEHIRLYDLQKRKELGTLLHHSGNVTVLRFFGSKWLLSGSSDGKICIWRTKDWEVLAELKGHQKSINDISIHKSGRLALSVSSDKTLHLWNLMTARKASVLRFPSIPLKVVWTPQGTHYIIGFDRKFVIYETESAKPVREIQYSSPLQHLDIIEIKGKDSESKNWLVTSHNDGKIVFRNLDNLLQPDLEETKIDNFELVAHATRVKQFSALIEDDVTYLCSISSDGRIVIWNLQTRQESAVYKSSDRLNCCILIPDDVEQYDTIKRSHDDNEAISDFSEAESDVETVKPMKKKKKSKVNIELN